MSAWGQRSRSVSSARCPEFSNTKRNWREGRAGQGISGILSWGKVSGWSFSVDLFGTTPKLELWGNNGRRVVAFDLLPSVRVPTGLVSQQIRNSWTSGRISKLDRGLGSRRVPISDLGVHLDHISSRIQHGNTSSELWVVFLLPPYDSSRIVCLILARAACASSVPFESRTNN